MVSSPGSFRSILSAVISQQLVSSSRLLTGFASGCLAIVLSAGGVDSTAAAQIKAVTSTGLTVTSGNGPAATVASGSVVTLTASVGTGTGAVTTGQVNFCDASAKFCTDVHLVGAGQLTSAGTAVLKFRPGVGTHSYRAVFLGTNWNAASASGPSTLKVIGTASSMSTATTLNTSGSWGNYTLTATVTETGGQAPPGGTVSFLDTSEGNAVLATVPAGAGAPALTWLNSFMPLTGLSPQFVAVGDFNGDGIPDLAVTNLRSNNVTILLGNGDGTFTAAPVAPPTGNGPVAIVAADFNSDGCLDLAVVNGAGGGLTILLGHGDGTFTPAPVNPTMGTVAAGLAVADFNGDGIPDLAVTDPFSNTVTIFLGNGDGTFSKTPVSPPAGDSPYAVVAGDFNGDGKADLAVTSLSGDAVTILPGNGDGTFAASRAIPQPAGPGYAIVAGDFNGDGNLDLATGNTNGTLSILLGNGDGTFTSMAPLTVAGTKVVSVAVSDLNGDGIPDLVASSYGGGVSVFLGRGDGTFNSAASVETGSADTGLLVADLDGDGEPDVVVANNGNGTLSVLLTEVMETVATSPVNISLTGSGQHRVVAAYSGDGNDSSSFSPAIMLWGEPPPTATTLTVTAGGSSASATSAGTAVTLTAQVTMGGRAVTAGQVEFCDASASHCADSHLLATVELTSSGTALYKFVPGIGQHVYKALFVENGWGLSSASNVASLTVNQAAGALYPTRTGIAQSGSPGNYALTATVTGTGGQISPTGTVSFIDTTNANAVLGSAPLTPTMAGWAWLGSLTSATGSLPRAVAVGDFNGDGIPDLAITNANSNNVTIFLGKGDGTFKVGSSPVVGTNPDSIVTGDFNGDGKTDLAVSNLYSGTVTILLGNGNGTFTTKASPVVGASPEAIATGDFNGDGKLDLVTANYGGSGFTILLGNGDGTFSPVANPIPGESQSLSVAVGDFNGDGIPDLAITNSSGGLTIFLGNGDGTFSATGSAVAVGITPSSLAVADFNADGIPDLAIADAATGFITILLGNGDGNFREAANTPVVIGGDPASIVAADFNQDGKADLAAANYAGNSVMILYGNGDGTFTASALSPATGNAPYGMAAADFNGDGIADLAVANSGSKNVSVLLPEPTQTASATIASVSVTGLAATHQIEASYSGDADYASSISSATTVEVLWPAPVISPGSGTYTSIQKVTITDATPGAVIYYTTNGFAPNASSLVYKGPITVSAQQETIQAIAVRSRVGYSACASATYTLNLPTPAPPVLSLRAGVYSTAQTVKISDATAGAIIYYTTNGTLPSASSARYASPITVSASETLVAIAVYGYAISSPASAQYIIVSSSGSLIYTIAGNGTAGCSGDGGPATLADLNRPSAAVKDTAGNLYIADSGNNVIRKVAAGTGIVATIAGNEIAGYSGDGGPATNAQLNSPSALALDSAGNLYIADAGNNVIRRINTVTGVITTYAGNGKSVDSGDSGPPTEAGIVAPEGIALDSLGDLYIAEPFSNRIREVVAAAAMIMTVAGTGKAGYSGDGGAAANATLNEPMGVAIDSQGDLYIADALNNVVRRVKAGVISTVVGSGSGAGSGKGSYSGDGGLAINATLHGPVAVSADGTGNLYVMDRYNQVIRKVTANNGIITTIAGNAIVCNSFGGDGGASIAASLCFPSGISVDAAGNLYVADTGSSRVREVTVSALPPTTSTAAPVFSISPGSYASPQTVSLTDSTPGAAIYLTMDGTAVSTASPGYNVPISVTGNAEIHAVAVAPGYLPSAATTASYTIASVPAAVMTTVAGSGVFGLAGPGGPATNAQIGYPKGVALDGAGNVYFSDSGNNVVWMIAAASGNLLAIAGNGTAGFAGDGGPATSAELNSPQGVAVDRAGNVYIADANNNVVRKVAPATGIMTTFAGQCPAAYSGDGGPAISALLNHPVGLTLDRSGNLYIADSLNDVVRMVSASSGIITTVAGNPQNGSLGDGGPAIAAAVFRPEALAFDPAGNLYIATPWAGRVRKVVAGVITTVAGNGDLFGDSGDGSLATTAEIDPEALAVDAAGNLYLANGFGSVREVAASTGIITRVGGNGYSGYSGDGASATVAEVSDVQGMAFDGAGNLYIADTNNFRVRKVAFSSAAATPVISVAGGTYTSVQNVAITDTTPDVVIYYTVDGSTPTDESTVCSGPIAVSGSETLQAIAVAGGYTQSSVASAAYTIRLPVPPNIVVAVSAASITSAQPLTVVVTAAGPSGSPTPTGTVILKGGTYSTQQALVNGSAAFSLASGVLPVGNDPLTATYSPDATSAEIYAAATQTSSITVNAAGNLTTAAISLTPSASAITNQQGVSIKVLVSGENGEPTPTGSVSVTSGAYISLQPLSGGTTTFQIPAGALIAGPNVVTAAYSGDGIYTGESANITITVSQVVIAAPVSSSVSPGSSATGTLTLWAGSTYAGTMNLACTLHSAPSEAQSLPACSLNPARVTIASGGNGTSVMTIQTMAANKTAARINQPNSHWLGGAGTAFATLFLFGCSAKRRRQWSSLALVLGLIVAGNIGCGSRFGAISAPASITAATSAGTYTFTVTGTDAADPKITASADVTIAVQ